MNRNTTHGTKTLHTTINDKPIAIEFHYDLPDEAVGFFDVEVTDWDCVIPEHELERVINEMKELVN